MPRARATLGVEREDIRAVNPNHLRARRPLRPAPPGSDMGGCDSTAFWARGGSADGVTPVDPDPR